MGYYFSKILAGSFEEGVNRAVEALRKEGFGILTEIDVREKMQEKLGRDFRPYRILGACNPPLAWEALQVEDKIGTMLPCNVIVQELGPGTVEVAAIDPVASMKAVENAALREIGEQVRIKLKEVVEKL